MVYFLFSSLTIDHLWQIKDVGMVSENFLVLMLVITLMVVMVIVMVLVLFLLVVLPGMPRRWLPDHGLGALCGDRGGGGGGGGGGEGGGEEGPWRRIEERRPPHLQSTSASPILNWIENQDHIIRHVLVQNPS